MLDNHDHLLLPVITDDSGNASWNFATAVQVPTWAQVLVFDPTSPNGLLTFSNAVRRLAQ